MFHIPISALGQLAGAQEKKSIAGPGRRSERPGGAPAGPRAAGLTSSHSPAAGAPQAAAARSAPAPLAREQPEVPAAVLRFGAKIQESGCADRAWGGREVGVGPLPRSFRAGRHSAPCSGRLPASPKAQAAIPIHTLLP